MDGRRTRRRGGGFIAALGALVALALAPASAALADTRHAAPGGTSADDCSAADPCDFETAVEGAASGDVVELAPGTYVESDRISTLVPVAINGPVLPDRAVLQSSADYALSLNAAGSSVSRLDISHTGDFGALYLVASDASHVRAHSSGGSASTSACWLAIGAGTSTLSESVCWNSNLGKAINAESLVNGLTIQGTIRNVTAIASGTPGVFNATNGLRVVAANGGTASVQASGLITRGTTPTGGDILVSAGAGSTATLTIGYSNYENASVQDAGGTATLTPTAGNQTADPLFVDAANGDYHQAPGSPTIDAGDPAAPASTDLDGDARPDGSAIDIGADERVTAPLATIDSKPRKRTRRRVASFTYSASKPGATFECRLDARAWAPCPASGVTYRRLARRRHTFRVRATAAELTGPAAEYSWRILRRR